MRTDDIDPVKSKLYAESEPFLSVYPDYDIQSLPSWVSENIDNARVYGNSKKGIILSDGRKYHLDNHLNDMTGREWTFFINSVFSTHYPTSGKEAYAHNIRKIHPTPKPPQLMRDLIQFFSKENELVLDTFMGVGGTLLGAALCSRRAAGIELNQEYMVTYCWCRVWILFPLQYFHVIMVLFQMQLMKLLYLMDVVWAKCFLKYISRY